jgi:processive 1,2-diacylglycerol beta-glucosyltransferase
VPTITVITDHTDHRYWIHPYTDHYLVGSDAVKQKLTAAGLKEEQVTVTGIPIRPQFTLSHSGDEVRRKYGFEPGVPTLLIMGGSWGFISDGVEMLRLFDRFPEPLQIFFVCGRNRELWEQVNAERANLKQRIVVTQYCEEVDQLMAASDLIVTKPGGVTTTEAIAMEVPMILCKPLPGQEEDNTQFLLNAGVAVLAADASDVVENVRSLLQDPDKLRAMRENERRFSFKQSAFAASDVIFSYRARKEHT